MNVNANSKKSWIKPLYILVFTYWGSWEPLVVPLRMLNMRALWTSICRRADPVYTM